MSVGVIGVSSSGRPIQLTQAEPIFNFNGSQPLYIPTDQPVPVQLADTILLQPPRPPPGQIPLGSRFFPIKQLQPNSSVLFNPGIDVEGGVFRPSYGPNTLRSGYDILRGTIISPLDTTLVERLRAAGAPGAGVPEQVQVPQIIQQPGIEMQVEGPDPIDLDPQQPQAQSRDEILESISQFNATAPVPVQRGLNNLEIAISVVNNATVLTVTPSGVLQALGFSPQLDIQTINQAPRLWWQTLILARFQFNLDASTAFGIAEQLTGFSARPS